MNRQYNDRKFKYLHPRDQLVMIMERIYGYGMTTTSGGNISVLDEDGVIWITPGGVDKGGLKRDDIVWITPDGAIHGKHSPSSEFPFHRAIYRARPDLRAVLHAHPPALVAFSAAGRVPATDVLPNTRIICGDVGFVPYALPGSEELGSKIADSFSAGHNIVILENHGTVTAAEDLFRAFMRFETLDFTARVQIKARSLGAVNSFPEETRELLALKKNELPEFEPPLPKSAELSLRREMCDLIVRSYDQSLFTSTEGTFAVRLGEDSFLITPYGYDRKYLVPEDLVLIDGGRREAGKLPSRSVLLHREIFKANPKMNAVLIAHPPNLMAFNVTGTQLDTRVIPEAYILLRDIAEVSVRDAIVDFSRVAETLSESCPIAMIRNNGIIVTGETLLKAFDRLEVAEFSAKAVLGAHELGTVKSIGEAEVADLKKAFKLKD